MDARSWVFSCAEIKMLAVGVGHSQHLERERQKMRNLIAQQ